MNVGAFLRDMCRELLSPDRCKGRVKRAQIAIDDVLVTPACAASLAVIVGELVINAVKHAHPSGVPGDITVTCHRDPTHFLIIEVSDDGVGLPEKLDPYSAGGIGLAMMRAQCAQIGSRLSFQSSSLGLRVQLRVPPHLCRVALSSAPHDGHSGDGQSPSAKNDNQGGDGQSPLAKNENRRGDGQAALSLDGQEPAKTERYFRDLLQALPAAIYTTDTAGRITFYNDAAAALWGFHPELGKSEFCDSWKLFWPDGTPMSHDECPMAEALRERRPIRGEEAIAERPDGVRIPFIPFPSPLYDDDGMMTGAVNMLVDISERKKAEQAAHWLAAIIESSDDAIISKDLDGNFTSWNPGAERLFGYSAEEIIGRPGKTIVPDDRPNEEPELLERIRSGDRIEHYETVRVRKDGKKIPVALTVSPIKIDGAIRGASKIVRDITERKETEAWQTLLAEELNHRTKNLFSVVHVVVSRSFAGKRSVKEAEKAVMDRLASLAQTHVMLVQKDWQGADLADVVRSEIGPYAERISAEGPSLMLSSQAAQNFALALHELATNAAKYGALSNSTGQVRISWSVDNSVDRRQFTFRWEERGGPSVTPPTQRGFGSSVLEQVMGGFCETPPRLDYAESGLVYELRGSVRAIAGQARSGRSTG